MLHRFRLIIAGALIILINQAVTFAVSAHMPSALLPAGTVRFATASASSAENIEEIEGWVDLPGMTKYITIPGGQTADVMVIFCGNVATDSLVAVEARAMVRDVLAAPSTSPLKFSVNLSSSQCATFYKTNVTAGSPAVKIQWRGWGPGHGYMDRRSMIVIVNTH